MNKIFNYAKVALYSLLKVNLTMHSYAMFKISLEIKGLQFFMKFEIRDIATFALLKIS